MFFQPRTFRVSLFWSKRNSILCQTRSSIWKFSEIWYLLTIFEIRSAEWLNYARRNGIDLLDPLARLNLWLDLLLRSLLKEVLAVWEYPDPYALCPVLVLLLLRRCLRTLEPLSEVSSVLVLILILEFYLLIFFIQLRLSLFVPWNHSPESSTISRFQREYNHSVVPWTAYAAISVGRTGLCPNRY